MDAIKRLFYPLGMATLLGFFAILLNYSSDAFQRIDQKASDMLQGNQLLGVMSIFAEQWFIFAVSIILILFLWLHRRNYRGMLFVFLSVGAGNALNQLLKFLFERPRPEFPHGPESFSFPSGHAMVGLLYLFTAAYFITDHLTSKNLKWLVWAIAAGLTIIIGLSRVAQDEHFFSDILAGWFAGYSWFVAVAVWYELRERFLKNQLNTEERG